ncbi:hypothetical protein [Tenacibaculum halocynthiae]|uniref:hypothetical protein n=1 Tax=Tenacibaculum halocynthiae TaxID=1254437 RepID=UPI003D6568F3
MNRKNIPKLVIILVLYISPIKLLAQNENKVYYILYKIISKEKGGNSENSYRTDIFPATLSSERYKKIKSARKKMWSNSNTTIRTVKRKLSPLDRIVLIKYNYKNSSRKYSVIKLEKISNKSKNYNITSSEIVEKENKSSMIRKYYVNNEVLYDGTPFTNSKKERNVFKENLKKAQGLGVRG